MYFGLKKNDQALADCDKAISLDPKSTDGYVVSARILNWTGKFQPAVEAAEKALALNPKEREALDLHTHSLNELNQPDKAIPDDLNELISQEPDNARAHQLRSFSYLLKGDFKKSFDDATKAVALGATNPSVFNTRAECQEQLGNDRGAIDDYTQAIEKNPGYAAASRNRGLIYDRLNEYDKAFADFTEAIRRDPKFVDAYGSRSELCKRVAALDEAKISELTSNKAPAQ